MEEEEEDNPRLGMLLQTEKLVKAAPPSTCKTLAIVTLEQSKGFARTLHEKEAQLREKEAELAALREQLAARAPGTGPSTVRARFESGRFVWVGGGGRASDGSYMWWGGASAGLCAWWPQQKICRFTLWCQVEQARSSKRVLRSRRSLWLRRYQV